MKKILIISSLFFAVAASAQTTATIVPGGGVQATPTDRTGVVPPENVKAKFLTDHPGTTEVSWKVDGENFRVFYTDPETKMGHIIVYDKDGKVIRKENEVDNLTYPSDINEYYSKKYPKESYKVWQTEREPGEINYYITRKNKILWFDQTGKLIPQQNKTIK